MISTLQRQIPYRGNRSAVRLRIPVPLTPLKHVRYAKRVMSDTVCIAASCVDLKTGRVFAVLCSDGRIEIDGLGSGNIGQKCIHVAPGVSAMFSDSLPKAKELVDRYIKFLTDPKTQWTEDNALELLREPLECQNRADATAYLSASCGMEYEEFLELDSGAQTNLIVGLEQWKSKCQLLIVCLATNVVRMFLVTDRVEEQSMFGAIGCGANAALASLYSRAYATYHDLEQAIYYVYEAKRSSDHVPGVGKETYLSVLEFNDKQKQTVFYNLNNDEMTRLSQQYAQFGPRPFGQPPAELALNLKFIPGLC